MSSGPRALRIPQGPSIGRRLLSVFYESLVVFAIIFFAGLAFYGAANGRLSGGTRHAFQLYLFLVLGIYSVACWSRAGRTLPMQTWKLRLVRDENLPVAAGRPLRRYALACPSRLPLDGAVRLAFLDL